MRGDLGSVAACADEWERSVWGKFSCFRPGVCAVADLFIPVNADRARKERLASPLES